MIRVWRFWRVDEYCKLWKWLQYTMGRKKGRIFTNKTSLLEVLLFVYVFKSQKKKLYLTSFNKWRVGRYNESKWLKSTSTHTTVMIVKGENLYIISSLIWLRYIYNWFSLISILYTHIIDTNLWQRFGRRKNDDLTFRTHSYVYTKIYTKYKWMDNPIFFFPLLLKNLRMNFALFYSSS